MNVTLNGQRKEMANAINLKEIIEQFCNDSNHVIAELNGQIIKKAEWAQSRISEGDTIELVNFVGGG